MIPATVNLKLSLSQALTLKMLLARGHHGLSSIQADNVKGTQHHLAGQIAKALKQRSAARRKKALTSGPNTVTIEDALLDV